MTSSTYVVISIWFGCNNRCTICMLGDMKGKLPTIGYEPFKRVLCQIRNEGRFRNLILSAAEVTTFGLRATHRAVALVSFLSGLALWTLVEYVAHRYGLHGVYPPGATPVRRWLHRRFDGLHVAPHERPWDEFSGDLDRFIAREDLTLSATRQILLDNPCRLYGLKPEELAELRTLGQIVDYMSASTMPVDPPEKSSDFLDIDEDAFDDTFAERIRDEFIRVVSDKTGYPAEMLPRPGRRRCGKPYPQPTPMTLCRPCQKGWTRS